MLGAALVWAVLTSQDTQASAAKPQWSVSGKWVVEFADQQCLARRPFSFRGKEVTVAILPWPASDGASLWLLLGDTGKKLNDAQIMVGGERTKVDGLVLKGQTTTKQFVHAAYLDGPAYARLRSTKLLSISSNQLRGEFTLASLEKVQTLLEACNLDLLNRWGFPQAGNLASFAVPGKSIVSYFQTSDYPFEAIRDGASGEALVAIRVGVDGQGKSCRLLQSAGHKALDRMTCAVTMRRARYTPARDKTGSPVEAPFITRIRWVMPQ